MLHFSCAAELAQEGSVSVVTKSDSAACIVDVYCEIGLLQKEKASVKDGWLLIKGGWNTGVMLYNING